MMDWAWLFSGFCSGALLTGSLVTWRERGRQKILHELAEEHVAHALTRCESAEHHHHLEQEQHAFTRAVVDDLKMRCEQLQNARRQVEALLLDSQEQHVRQQRRHAVQVQAHEKTVQENRQLTLTCQRLQNAYTRCREAWDQLRKDRDHQHEKVRTLQKKFEELEPAHTRITGEVDHLRAQLAALNTAVQPEVDAAQRDAQSSRLQLDRLKRSLTLARQEKTLVEQALRQALEKTTAQWREQVAARAAQLEAQAREHARTIDELEAIRAQHHFATSQLNQTREMLDRTALELGKTRATLDRTTVDRSQNAAEVERLREELAHTQQAIDEVRAHTQERWYVEDQRGRLERALDASRRELVQTRAELDKAQAQLSHARRSGRADAGQDPIETTAVPIMPLEFALANNERSAFDDPEQQRRILHEFRLRIRMLENQLEQRDRLAEENLRLRLQVAEGEAALAAHELDQAELARLRASELARTLAHPQAVAASTIEQGSAPLPEAHELTDQIDAVLQQVMAREGASTAVLADVHGLTVWAVGRNDGPTLAHDSLAALAAEADSLAARAQEFLPIASIREINLVDAHDTLIRGRFLSAGPDRLTLMTVGPSTIALANADAAISALRRALFPADPSIDLLDTSSQDDDFSPLSPAN